MAGGLIEHVRKRFIYTKLNSLKPKSLECICPEITFSNKKWIYYSIYRSPSSKNLEVFFSELTDSLSKTNKKYKNVNVMSDFNIDIGLSYGEYDKL